MNTKLSASFNRRLRNPILGIIVLGVCASIGRAQTSLLPLPEGNGGWVLQVVTRGGLDGQGKGDLWITSKGELNCSRKEMSCAREVAKKTADVLTQGIRAVTPAIWNSPGSNTLCPDCLVTTMRVAIRSNDGSVQTFEATWDITTQGHVPEELLRLYNAAASQNLL